MPMSEAFSISFILFNKTLLHKALNDQASFLVPDWILLLQRPRILASFCVSVTTFQSHHFIANRCGNSERLYFLGLQNHCRWWLQPWNQKTIAPLKKAMTNLDSILKSRDITLPTEVLLVKVMVFPVVTYGYDSWTIKKAEHQRIDAFELWCWRRLLGVPWIAWRSNRSILKEISPEYSM